MVAGEFAVLEKGYPLLVMAVDRYVYATIEDAEVYQFTSENFNLYNLTWRFNGKYVIFDNYSPRLKFATNALATVLTFLKEKGIPPTPFSLTVRSELDDEATGAKYGLGSSAAVVTAIITAVLEKFLRYPPAKSLIFKLAAIAHVRTQGSGSGADIAASTYGGVLYYKSFQANWLLRQLRRQPRILPVIQQKWRYLHISQVAFPEDVTLCIGWTGKPASTKNLVSEIANLRKEQPAVYNRFLQESKQAVQTIMRGMEEGDVPLFLRGIKQNRRSLRFLGERANVPIETEALARLSEIAEAYDGAGKLSGAGGGDCGIAFLYQETNTESLLTRWQEASIQPLDLSIDSSGTSVVTEEKSV